MIRFYIVETPRPPSVMRHMGQHMQQQHMVWARVITLNVMVVAEWSIGLDKIWRDGDKLLSF